MTVREQLSRDRTRYALVSRQRTSDAGELQSACCVGSGRVLRLSASFMVSGGRCRSRLEFRRLPVQ